MCARMNTDERNTARQSHLFRQARLSISMASDQAQPVFLNCVFLGDGNVGKTSYAIRACADMYTSSKQEQSAQIVTHSFESACVPEGRQIQLTIYDPSSRWLRNCAAEQRDLAMGEIFKNADFVVFFMSDRDADEHVRMERWIEMARPYVQHDTLMCFVLNQNLERNADFFLAQLERIRKRERGFAFVVNVAKNENVFSSLLDMACASYYAARLIRRDFVRVSHETTPRREVQSYERLTDSPSDSTSTSAATTSRRAVPSPRQQQQQLEPLTDNQSRRAANDSPSVLFLGHQRLNSNAIYAPVPPLGARRQERQSCWASVLFPFC